jgi:hypothetical protein
VHLRSHGLQVSAPGSRDRTEAARSFFESAITRSPPGRAA